MNKIRKRRGIYTSLATVLIINNLMVAIPVNAEKYDTKG